MRSASAGRARQNAEAGFTGRTGDRCALAKAWGLALWKKYVDRQGAKPDAEDQDLSELYNRYKAFLDENGFFDPAWETPPFDANGKKYFIFFPEISTLS